MLRRLSIFAPQNIAAKLAEKHTIYLIYKSISRKETILNVKINFYSLSLSSRLSLCENYDYDMRVN